MRTIKSYQEQVQGNVEDVISTVEKQYKSVAGATFDYAEKLTNIDALKRSHNKLVDKAYGKVREINNLVGETAGELILKFEKPQTPTQKVKATAKKTVSTAKKKATAVKKSSAKATKKVAKKIEDATA